MTVKLIHVTPDAEQLLLYMARVSNPDNQNSGNVKLIRYLIEHKHFSPFEMVSAAIEIETSRAISPQILRHRSFSFQEFSQRYASVDSSGLVLYAARRADNKNRQNSIDDLPEHIKQEWIQRQQDNWKRAFEHYTWALDNGIAKECARMVLPLQTSTRMYMHGSLRSWMHYLAVRIAPDVQKEHRDLAVGMLEVLRPAFPETFKALAF